jgi:hypothetical protein
MWRSLLIIGTLALASCSYFDRPDIDVAPYQSQCKTYPADTCPAPYECTVLRPASGPSYLSCYVPCSGDGDCPDGFSCGALRYDYSVSPPQVCQTD